MFGVVIGALTVFWWTRPEATRAAMGTATQCRQMYELARTAADTARVDELYGLGNGGHGAMTCGALRAAHLIPTR